MGTVKRVEIHDVTLFIVSSKIQIIITLTFDEFYKNLLIKCLSNNTLHGKWKMEKFIIYKIQIFKYSTPFL